MSLGEQSKFFKVLKIDKLVDHLAGYLDTKLELTKLEIEEKFRVILAHVFHNFLTILSVATFLLFLNVGISLYINTFFGNNFAGFFIVSCFYLIFVLFFMLDKNKTFSTKITDRIFRNQDQKKDE